MSARRALLPLVLLALAPPGLACAQVATTDVVWEDPTLAEAVRAADAVVLGRAVSSGADGAVYGVERVFRGPVREGEQVSVVGLHHPERLEPDGTPMRNPVAAGDRAYLVLRAAGTVYALPTPTLGRFPLRDLGGPTVVACLNDTFVRIGVPQAIFEGVLAGLLAGGASPALLEEARAAAAPDQEPANVYLGLEVLALFGTQDDLPRIAAALECPAAQGERRFQVRVAAARALGRAGGPEAARRLLLLVEQDPVEAVQSVAATSLGRVLVEHRGAAGLDAIAARLATRGLTAGSAPIPLGGAHDPRTNALESPLAAILRSLVQAQSRAGAAPALRALEREDDLEAVVAGLSYFSALGDVEHSGQVAYRMRAPDAEDAYVNRLFARTLEGLTGQRLGDSRDAWLRWWQDRTLGPPGSPR